jgi:hypothetical protein
LPPTLGCAILGAATGIPPTSPLWLERRRAHPLWPPPLTPKPRLSHRHLAFSKPRNCRRLSSQHPSSKPYHQALSYLAFDPSMQPGQTVGGVGLPPCELTRRHFLRMLIYGLAIGPGPTACRWLEWTHPSRKIGCVHSHLSLEPRNC